MAYTFTQQEVDNLYKEWYRSGTDKDFREYFGLTSAEMKQINSLDKPENPYE